MQTGKKVTVLGLGKSGFQSALFLKGKGYTVFVSELKDTENVRRFASSLREQGIECETGMHSMERILASDWLLLSPGISPATPVYRAAFEKKIPLISEIEAASWFCASRRIVAVTGSSGKTTVTTLLARVHEAAGLPVICCGNIGNPWIGELAHIDEKTTVVLELSSFQLQHCFTFAPRVGVLLNIAPNHQDWHRDMTEYAEAKLRMFQNQGPEDFAVIRAQDRKMLFPRYPFRGKVVCSDDQPAANPNYEAVRHTAAILGLPAEAVETVLRDFRGLEHRMERVAVHQGIEYVNDSKSTTTASLAWALNQYGDGKVLLIAGGIAKSSDYADIRDLIARKAKAVFLIGKAVPVFREAWKGTVPIRECRDLGAAVDEASRAAAAGDTVLLSPACSSFDMFQNYEHRGREFKRYVAELSCGAGAAPRV